MDKLSHLLAESELPHSLSGPEVNRYSRQLLLHGIGVEGQEKLKNAKVLVVGAGGLGCPAMMYLAGAGVGTIGVIDHDTVDISNLHRQVMHSSHNTGMSKAVSAKNFIQNLNPNVNVEAYPEALNIHNSKEIVPKYDIILDGSDNAETRYLINDLGVFYGKPIVSGCALKWEGQLTIYGVGPCYRCIYPEPAPASMRGNCSGDGVMGGIPGIIGTLQAIETVKLILGLPNLVGKLLVYDGYSTSFRVINLRGKRSDCLACNKELNPHEFNYTEFAGGTCTSMIHIDERFVISPDNYKEELAQKDHVIIDVRPASQFKICRLQNSISIPMEKLGGYLEILRELTHTIVIICKRGITARRAAQYLLENNISNIQVLDGGLEGWRRVDAEFPAY